MNNFKAVIFDIDGTLADSMGVWTESDRIFLSRRGIEYDIEVSAVLKSMHFMSAAEYLKNLYSLPESTEEVAREITDIVREKYFFEVKLMPYAKELIQSLSERGIKMCAATSNSRELAEGGLRHNGILESLEFIVTSDEAGSSKDDPKIFFMCAEKLGVSPSETAVIEDSPHAAKTAFENGFYTIGVNSGHFGDFDALKGVVHRRIESFKELI
ncbi:MAG: HAD family phosphatase [Oscillospiraceae bacterium]|nr:HAD family phosphatase [Oscillospiraceae bacterium]